MKLRHKGISYCQKNPQTNTVLLGLVPDPVCGCKTQQFLCLKFLLSHKTYRTE